MKKGRPKGTGGKARVLTKLEIDSAISTLSSPNSSGKHDFRNSVILSISYYLGLRVKEITGLNVRDVYYVNGKVVTSIHLKVTKGQKVRTVYIPNKLKTLLELYLKSNSQIANQLVNLTYPLFKSQKGGRFTPNTMQMLLKNIYSKFLLEGCSSHTGRRSFATRLIEKGADIKAVSTLMGHSSINMTARYVEDNPARLQNMVDALL